MLFKSCGRFRLSSVRIGFLGPAGTFSEAALRQYEPDAEAIPFVDVPAALAAVRHGDVDASIVPIESSVEGGVNATLDTLGEGDDLVIVGETLVPITFALSVREDFTGEITHVGSHPHGWAQCRKFLTSAFPHVEHVPTPSTAAAAELLAAGEADFDAALSSTLSAKQYGLRILHDGVADNPNAITRFVVVQRPGHIPEPTGADKTTLQVHLAHNNAGGLLEMLEQFAVRGVNLSRIESRPIGDALGRYAFSIDAEGHIHEERLQAVLIGLHRVCPQVRFIGSYPTFDGTAVPIQPGTSDQDFLDARAWVDSLVATGRSLVGGAGATVIPDDAGPATALSGDSRERIIQAAQLEFAALGYDGASLRHIAAFAGVDPSLVPYHFGGKEELFQHVVLQNIGTPQDLIEAIRDPAKIASLLIGESGGIETLKVGQLSLTAAIRTALTPASLQQGPVHQDLREKVRRIFTSALEESDNPGGTQALLNLLIGILTLRNICPIVPLSTIGADDLQDLLRARMALIDPDACGDDSSRGEVAPVLEALDEPPSGLGDLPAKERIFHAGRYLFAKRGYQGASLREIASLAQCDISLVHYYFGSKFGLMEAVVDQALPEAELEMDPQLSELENNHRLGSAVIDVIAHDPVSSAGFRALLRTLANPGDEKVAALVQERIQHLIDTSIQRSGRPDIDMGFYLLAAETLGAAALDETLAGLGPDPQCQLKVLLRRALEAEEQGLSIVQLVNAG